MILRIDDSISRYYAESLVLLFFPGAKFPADEEAGDYVELSSKIDENSITGYAKISALGKTVDSSYTIGFEGRSTVLRAVGGAMLLSGEKIFGIVPPWGMLTGVRPAKTALNYLYRYGDIEKASEMLHKEYLCSERKIDIAMKTAMIEKEHINENTRKACSLYIAVPFCPTKCSYCSFTSFSSPRLLSLLPAYLDRVCIDIANITSLIYEMGLSLETVYIGGGTPTTFNEKQLATLLECVVKNTRDFDIKEFTVEAGRPDTITYEKLSVMNNLGVSRVSVNCQTLNNEILASIGRKHTGNDFLEAYDITKKSGIKDVNVDLIAGLPSESFESFKNSLDTVISLDPTNITVHTFYAKRAAEIVKDGNVYNIQDRTAILDVDYADESLISNGYSPYYMYKQKNTMSNLENTGFSKDGHECLYNIYMMEEVHSVFGAGASSMTKLVSPSSVESKILRLSETKYPYEYLETDKNSPKDRIRFLREKTLEFFNSQKEIL